MLGRRKRKLSCMAWAWVRTSVERKSPSAEAGHDEGEGQQVEQGEIPLNRHAEHQAPQDEDDRDLHVADQQEGEDLAQHQPDLLDRGHDQLLQRAALALAHERPCW